MNLKNLFGIFLVLVLVSISVYFVAGIGSSFTTPSAQEFVKGNYTLTITYNTTFQNVTNITLYLLQNSTYSGWQNSSWINNSIIEVGYPLTNLTNSSTATMSIIVNTANFSSLLDGNYTIMALISNNVTRPAIVRNEFVNVTVYVDHNPPSSLNLIYPINQTFIDNTSIQFGFIVTDSMSGNLTRGNAINCTFKVNGTETGTTYVNNSLIVANNSIGLGSNYTNWFNVSVTNFGAGYHVWNISCVDFNNNVNSSLSVNSSYWKNYRFGGNFTLTDTQGPTISTPTLSASSVADGTSVTVTCTGTDTITVDPQEYVSIKGPLNSDWQGDLGTSPYAYTGTTDVGTYTTRCRAKDSTGNFGSYSSEVTFAVTKIAGSTSTSTSGGSSGGGSSSKETVVVSVYQGQTEDLGNLNEIDGVINAYQSSTITFTTSSSAETTASAHSVKFDEVDYINGEITITISSDPITFTMKTGETKNVDLDGDGVEDIEVKLNSIDENGRVNMNVRNIATTQTQEETPDTTPEAAQPEETKETSFWIWWVLIVVVIVVIIALLLPKKKRK